MGMFDYLVDFDAKCPWCGNWNTTEIQTKDTAPQSLAHLYVYHPGCAALVSDEEWAKAAPNMKRVRAHFSCSSPVCGAIARMIQYMKTGYSGSGSAYWHMEYKINRGGRVCAPAIFTTGEGYLNEWAEGKYFRQDFPRVFMEWLEPKLKKDRKAREAWRLAMVIGVGDPMLAIHYFHYDFNKKERERKRKSVKR